jgi:hypothetical protein
MSHRLKIIFSSCVMSLFALTLISASPVDAGIQVRSSDDLVTQRGGEGPKSLRTPMRSLGTQYAAKKLKEKFKKFGKSVKKAGKKVGKKLGKSKFGKSVIKAGKKVYNQPKRAVNRVTDVQRKITNRGKAAARGAAHALNKKRCAKFIDFNGKFGSKKAKACIQGK